MRKYTNGFFIAVLLAFLLSIEGCSPSTAPPITPLKTGEVTASISGLGTYYATNAFADSNSLITYHCRSSVLDSITKKESFVIDIIVSKKSPVPYSIDVSSDNYSSISYTIINPADDTYKTYMAEKGSGSGTIRITDISPTIQGSFSGTLQLVGGSETVSISNGAFNAAWQ